MTSWGNYSGTDLQCDEYPFASTKEGSNKATTDAPSA
ncbi:NucA/NucB deoxyribonuclease domain-containing protein [Streptomyces hygroscopicus]